MRVCRSSHWLFILLSITSDIYYQLARQRMVVTSPSYSTKGVVLTIKMIGINLETLCEQQLERLHHLQLGKDSPHHLLHVFFSSMENFRSPEPHQKRNQTSEQFHHIGFLFYELHHLLVGQPPPKVLGQPPQIRVGLQLQTLPTGDGTLQSLVNQLQCDFMWTI